MSTLIPSASACHTVQMPPVEKDDRWNLNVRTGSASTLHHSFVFTYGGLTIGLELGDQINAQTIETIFAAKVAGNKVKRMEKYLSGEIFYLDLISKVWSRVEIPRGQPKPRPRIFHELATGNDRLYLFGGLALRDTNAGLSEKATPDSLRGSSRDTLDDRSRANSRANSRASSRVDLKDAYGEGSVDSLGETGDDTGETSLLEPCNDLWEFDLLRKSWVLLHDGSNWQSDARVPAPRFCHKLTLISSLPFARKRDHSGLMVAGGCGENAGPIYANSVFDLVAKKYVKTGLPLTFPTTCVNGNVTSHFKASNSENHININYQNSVIVNFKEEDELASDTRRLASDADGTSSRLNESLFLYIPTDTSQSEEVLSPLLTAKIGRSIKPPKLAYLHRKRNLRSRSVTNNLLKRTVPHNLRYPTGGVFGQNIVIIGFLPGDYDISIFIYNKPTGKWARLNIFCNHDYGSHRFWGGFAWTSHHKVVLLGNYVTSHTTSSVRYFSSLITVSLPVTNVLASMEMAEPKVASRDAWSTSSEAQSGPTYSIDTEGDASTTSTSTSTSDLDTAASSDDASSSSLSQASDQDDTSSAGHRRFSNNSSPSDNPRQNAATFNDYVHYAAPKVKFTKVRSVFPPAAITLGRNAFDRYGNIISDFELISTNGDRIPVCKAILAARWGKFFIDLLAKAYVKAVDAFEQNQIEADVHKPRGAKSHTTIPGSSTRGQKTRYSSDESDLSFSSQTGTKDVGFRPMAPSQKEAPQFRLPFQEKASSDTSSVREVGSIDPHNQPPERRDSLSSGHGIFSPLRELPAQLPLPHEPIPDVPATPVSYRSTSRKNSTDVLSPRASLLHTLNVLRNIPAKSPKGSPRPSPRGSVCARKMSLDDSSSSNDESSLPENERTGLAISTMSDSSSMSPRAMSLDSSKSSATNSSGESRTQGKAPTHEMKSDADDHFHSLLDFPESGWETYAMEPALMPRKLYVPFNTDSLKAFAEYLYTGQVGNKWLFSPCALDCLWMARYYKVQLLYDLLCEVLYGIIGRKEVTVIREGKRYRKMFDELFERTRSPMKSEFKFPLDEYEGFLDTVDDGYMDIALLRKSSNVHKSSNSSRSGKRGSSFSLSKVEELPSKSEKEDKREDPATSKEETDDTSASDEDAPPLHFLGTEKKNSSSTIRYKSVFDKGISDYYNPANEPSDNEEDEETDNIAGVTLENIVSMDSPEPSDHVVDLIHEVASVCADVKLMLRAMNAREMSLALAQTKKDYVALEKRIQEELDTREEAETEEQKEVKSFESKRSQKKQEEIDDEDESPLKSARMHSTGSVTTLKSLLQSSRQKEHKDEASESGGSDQESKKHRAASGISLSKLTPVTEQSSGSVEQNRRLDRQISQLIRKEEKVKMKTARDEAKKHGKGHNDKKRSGTLSSVASSMSPAMSYNDSDATEGHKPQLQQRLSHNENLSDGRERKGHGLLGRMGFRGKHNKKEGTKKPTSAPELTRTESSTSMLSAGSKKSGTSMSGLFGKKKK